MVAAVFCLVGGGLSDSKYHFDAFPCVVEVQFSLDLPASRDRLWHWEQIYICQSSRSSGNGTMGFDLDTSCTMDEREYQYSLCYRVKVDPSKGTTQDPIGPIGLIGTINAFKTGRQWVHYHLICCDNATTGNWSATCKPNITIMTPDFHMGNVMRAVMVEFKPVITDCSYISHSTHWKCGENYISGIQASYHKLFILPCI
eukprot:10838976-Ditylum_brightwellii.AAC.1